jgi:hypothetical protein
MSGLNAIEMSSLHPARRNHDYRVQRRRPDCEEPTGTRSFARAALGPGRETHAARFYDADTVINHFDLLLRWLKAHGRPLALYTDRHSIFEPQGQAACDAETQFGRALRELDIELSGFC